MSDQFQFGTPWTLHQVRRLAVPVQAAQARGTRADGVDHPAAEVVLRGPRAGPAAHRAAPEHRPGVQVADPHGLPERRQVLADERPDEGERRRPVVCVRDEEPSVGRTDFNHTQCRSSTRRASSTTRSRTGTSSRCRRSRRSRTFRASSSSSSTSAGRAAAPSSEAALFQTLKPLFTRKPVVLVHNKTDIASVDALEAEDRAAIGDAATRGVRGGVQLY